MTGSQVELAFDLVLCGALLAGMSFLAQHLQPDFQRATLFTGLVGGGLAHLREWAAARCEQCRHRKETVNEK